MLLKVKYLISYGRALLYPVNKQAKCLCKMMKRKSFTQPQMKEMQAAGFNIEILAPGLDDLAKVEHMRPHKTQPEHQETPETESEPCQNTL